MISDGGREPDHEELLAKIADLEEQLAASRRSHADLWENIRSCEQTIRYLRGRADAYEAHLLSEVTAAQMTGPHAGVQLTPEVIAGVRVLAALIIGFFPVWRWSLDGAFQPWFVGAWVLATAVLLSPLPAWVAPTARS